MKTPFDPKSWTTPSDFSSVIDAQRRSFDAMARAGQIMAEAIRACAERHVKAAQGAFEDMVKVPPSSLNLTSPEEAWREHAGRLRGAMDRMAAHMGELQKVMTEAQLAAMEELQAAWGKNAPDAVHAAKLMQDEASKLTKSVQEETAKAVKKVQDAAAELMKNAPVPPMPKPAAAAATKAEPAPKPEPAKPEPAAEKPMPAAAAKPAAAAEPSPPAAAKRSGGRPRKAPTKS